MDPLWLASLGDHLPHCPSSRPLNLPAAGLFSRTRCHLHHLSSTRESFRPPRTRVHRQTGFMKARWVRDPAPQPTSRPGSGGAGETWPCGCPMEVEHRGWSITRQIDDAYRFLGHPVPSLHPGPPSEKEHQQSAKTNTFAHLLLPLH